MLRPSKHFVFSGGFQSHVLLINEAEDLSGQYTCGFSFHASWQTRGSSWLPPWLFLSFFVFFFCTAPPPHSASIIKWHWPDTHSIGCWLAMLTFLTQSLWWLTCMWRDYESFLFILKMRKTKVYWGGNLPQAIGSKLQSQDLSMKTLKHKHLINGFWEQHL